MLSQISNSISNLIMKRFTITKQYANGQHDLVTNN